jgi:hypothetical protein
VLHQTVAAGSGIEAFRAFADVPDRVALAVGPTGAGRFDGHGAGTLHITADAATARV